MNKQPLEKNDKAIITMIALERLKMVYIYLDLKVGFTSSVTILR